MAKLSLIFPSRNERFLISSIHDAFRNARGEFECIAVIDSDKWPEGWKEVCDKHPNLHTIFHGTPKGMRAAINSGVGSAISRGAKYIAKFDAHCSFSEGFDEILKAECQPNWIVVPRRGRLDPENWCETELNKPPIDYHYLSFPDNPDDFGGPGLNGKPWDARSRERKDILLDEEMSSQGSGWFMHAAYFTELELMDEAGYGPFWSEFQELGLKCWLSGGRVMVNKKAKYLHLHKGKKYGRGYRLEESALTKGRNQTMLWPWNEAWPKQTLPFEWLIDRFWPVPSWSENWREVLYATRKPRVVGGIEVPIPSRTQEGDLIIGTVEPLASKGLWIHSAVYGYDDEHKIDVLDRVRELVNGDCLDIVVNNSTLTPNDNPFRGKKKTLSVQYSFDGGEKVLLQRQEKDWLIIGPVRDRADTQWERGQVLRDVGLTGEEAAMLIAEQDTRDAQLMPDLKIHSREPVIIDGSLGSRSVTIEYPYEPREHEPVKMIPKPDFPPRTAAALNDYLIRRFRVSPQRLRGPMPIELRDFHRNDLAQLFAELGFKRGAEVGVAEGNYSEVILKANPQIETLYLVDPWHHYSDNPQGKSKEKHEFAKNEVIRKLTKYQKRITLVPFKSMDAIYKGEVDKDSLDFCYIDANHLFDFVMQDLIEWSKRVRSGGIISGDDYFQLDQKRWIGGGVVEAVQAYVNAHRIPIWFLFSGHKSVDYFWCKP